VLVSNDDFGSVNASRIVATLGSGGTHRIVVTSFSAGTTGQYSLTLSESEDVDPNQMSALQAQATMQMQNQYGGWQPQPTVYTPPDTPASTGGPHRERSGVLEIVSEPLNVTAAVGETFLTSLRVHNAAGRGFDEVILVLRYDPQMLRPLRVSDHKLRPLVAGEPRLTSSLREGWIRYEAMLSETLKSDGLDLLTIEWRALAPTGRTRVDVLANPQTGSSLRLDGRDVLGTDDETDGTVGCDVAVRPAAADHLLEGAQTSAAAQPGELALRLEAPAASVRVGETVDVDIVLLNPKPEAFDDLQLALRFDPRVFEVVDAARGGFPPTGDNWISRGVNLLDGPFHRAFPFDCHLRNEVDNTRGLADYRMGLTHPRALAGGTVARMTLRALAPAASTVIHFEQSPGADATTTVRLEGEDVLGRPDVPDDGTEGLQLRVEP
jgi:hypothetical protein